MEHVSGQKQWCCGPLEETILYGSLTGLPLREPTWRFSFFRNHKNKYDPITSLVYYDIVAAYVKKGKHRDAKKYMDVVIQRFERIFSEENDILKVNRLIHVELGRRQPDIAMILQMLWSLNVRRMSGEQ